MLHDDVTHAMTMTRTGLRAVERMQTSPHAAAAKIPVTPQRWHPDYAEKKKLTDFPIVARILGRAEESTTSTAPIDIPSSQSGRR